MLSLQRVTEVFTQPQPVRPHLDRFWKTGISNLPLLALFSMIARADM